MITFSFICRISGNRYIGEMAYSGESCLEWRHSIADISSSATSVGGLTGLATQPFMPSFRRA